MEEKKSCDAYDGTMIRHGEKSCCDDQCFICQDGKWVESDID